MPVALSSQAQRPAVWFEGARLIVGDQTPVIESSADLRDKLRSYGGCFNFRAKRSGSKLSTHAWGIAIDLNPETNGMGRDGDMPAGIVRVFESFGFTWGGRWSGAGKDPMHFQFCSGY